DGNRPGAGRRHSAADDLVRRHRDDHLDGVLCDRAQHRSAPRPSRRAWTDLVTSIDEPASKASFGDRITYSLMLLSWYGGLGSILLFVFLSSVRPDHPTPATGWTTALNNHGDFFYASKAEAIAASSAPAFVLLGILTMIFLQPKKRIGPLKFGVV